jgi:hypothetical protein
VIDPSARAHASADLEAVIAAIRKVATPADPAAITGSPS